MGVLRNIQLGLERYYDLVPFMDVEDCRLQRVGDVGHDRECLMVRTRGDYVELGLFVDPELEERAADFHGLGGPGLDAWAALVEGVSHFLYVGHCGTFDRRVSLNELEYQAEIDKFLFTAASFAQDSEQLSGNSWFSIASYFWMVLRGCRGWPFRPLSRCEPACTGTLCSMARRREKTTVGTD